MKQNSKNYSVYASSTSALGSSGCMITKHVSPHSHTHNANQLNNRSSSKSGHKPVPCTRKRGRVNGAYPPPLLLTQQCVPSQRKCLPPDDVYSLRTRMAFVQRSEKTLQEKQKHCASPFFPNTPLLSPYYRPPRRMSQSTTNTIDRYKSSPSIRECARSPCRLNEGRARLTSHSLATQPQWMNWLLASCSLSLRSRSRMLSYRVCKWAIGDSS